MKLMVSIIEHVYAQGCVCACVSMCSGRVCICACMCVHVRLCAPVLVLRVRVHLCVCSGACVYMCPCECTCGCVQEHCACVRTCVCIPTCVLRGMCVNLCVCLGECVHMCMSVCAPVRVLRDVHCDAALTGCIFFSSVDEIPSPFSANSRISGLPFLPSSPPSLPVSLSLTSLTVYDPNKHLRQSCDACPWEHVWSRWSSRS